MASNDGFLPHDAFHDLVETAVERIIVTEHLTDFLGWFSGIVYRRCLLERVPVDAGGAKLLGTHLGRSIWGATPAPHNDFKPVPLPMPGRNQPCFCGSGQKYKRCCAGAPKMPVLNPTELWPMVISALPPKKSKEIVASGQVPVDSLIVAAGDARLEDRPRTAVRFLESVFGKKIAGKDERYDHALNLLCDLYDELGRTRKKLELLDRIRSEVPRSPLRSSAFQRLATIRMDKGDSPGAWDAFREAQRNAPGDPLLGVLEVQLLLAENRSDTARERARFWRKRLMRLNDVAYEGLIEFLTGVIEDPHEALAGVLVEAADGAGQRLLEMVRSINRRPLPRYALIPDSARGPNADPEEAIAKQLRGMGVSDDDIRTMAPKLLEQARDIEPEQTPVDDAQDAHFALEAPKGIQLLEADWRAIFPGDKPFSIDNFPRLPSCLWEADVEEQWMGFLERHPEAFDSIDILDDLATAVEVHPMNDSFGLRESMQQPLILRAVDILRQTIEQADTPDDWILPWSDVDNRPSLRCLYRAQALAEERGDIETARAHAEWLIDLNPNDNHGVRTSLMNICLRTGDNEAAIALAARFPDDMFAELAYGRVLALVRIGRKDMAAEAARHAVDVLPNVRSYLIRKRARQLRLGPHGFALGSKEQAWLYREEMRDLWLAEPEAMELIRRTKPT